MKTKIIAGVIILCVFNFTLSASQQAIKEPNNFAHFKALPPGSVKAQGWLADYLQDTADSWMKETTEIRASGVYDGFWERDKCADYPKGHGCPDWPADYGDALIHIAHLLPDSYLGKELPVWMEKLLASQEKDGYIGGLNAPYRWNQWIEQWSSSFLLHGLIWHYQATGDPKILEAITKAADRAIEALHAGTGVNQGGIFAYGSTVGTFCKLYLVTGDVKYRDAAIEIENKWGKANVYLTFKHWNPRNDASSGAHSVIEGCAIRQPMMIYETNGDEKMYQASMKGWEALNKHLMVDGQPIGDEFIHNQSWIMSDQGPRWIGEHCGVVEWIISNIEMMRVAGEVKFADAIERAIFNAYPGAQSLPRNAVCYMHSANQLCASEWSHPHYSDYDGEISREFYTNAHMPLCCNVMSPRALPRFIENMAYKTKDGLAVAQYGPCKITADVNGAGKVELCQDTIYPFEDQVKITVNPSKAAEFTLRLRIPGWCKDASVELNANLLPQKTESGKFYEIKRKWDKGDTIVLKMNVPVALETYREGSLRVKGVAVKRGPLTFALPVEEDWQPIQNLLMIATVTHSKNAKGWNVLPKKGAIWNYGIMIDDKNPESSLSLKVLGDPRKDKVWQKPMLALEVKAKRVKNWLQEGSERYPMTPGLPIKPMEVADEIETIQLVPFGNTHLRFSFLPFLMPQAEPAKQVPTDAILAPQAR